jgi:intracellular sulfur oxidation DsrE/DsrF family protein
MAHRTLLTLLACLALITPMIADSGEASPPGIVFHVDSDQRMNRILRQIARHAAGNPTIPSRVILIAEGVRPAIEGAVDANGGDYSAQMEQLLMSGVRIFACENTLTGFNLSSNDLALGIETVPSGVAELGRLQVKEGWGYIKL